MQQVQVLGVIVNKVLPEKYERIKKALVQGLQNKGLKLLGVIPMDPILKDPTVEHIMRRLNLKVLCGEGNMHRRVSNTIVAAMEPENMVEYLKERTLILTSGDRVDNIMVAVSSHLVMQGQKGHISGIILTGGLVPNEKIIGFLKRSDIPVLLSEYDTYTIAGKIDTMVCKIEKEDKDKIKEAMRLVRQHVDVETILQNA